MQEPKYTAETYIKLYGDGAEIECKKMINISLTSKAEKHWNRVLYLIKEIT